VALVHATAYSDDRQMMTFIARRLEQAGLRPIFSSPAHLRWSAGLASVQTPQGLVPLDAIVRFFPGEWLTALPRTSGWQHHFAAGRTPTSNPATALLTQSKRWPLIWDALRTPLPTWRRLLPETRDPREAPWRTSDEWIVKPALGRVGEGIGMRDLIEPREWRSIRRGATFWPKSWVAQRRFVVSPVLVAGEPVYPCLGVYTVDGRVAGAYGRLARRPLIDSQAADAAVMTAA
jgi:glutathionylspermidine synthase